MCEGNIFESRATTDSAVEGDCTGPAVDCGGAWDGRRVASGMDWALVAPWNRCYHSKKVMFFTIPLERCKGHICGGPAGDRNLCTAPFTLLSLELVVPEANQPDRQGFLSMTRDR